MKEPNYHFYAYLGAVLTLATILVLGLFSTQQPLRMAAKVRAQAAEAIERGAEIYDHDCASCHGDHGQGERNSGPALNTREFLSAAVDESIFNTIVDGRPGTASKDHKPAKERRWFSHEGLLVVLTLLVLGFVLYNLWGLLTLLWIPLGQ